MFTIASNEHTQGQSLLAKELAAFGYYTISYLKNPVISPEQFFALVRKFHLPHIRNFDSFSTEFDFLLRGLDPRYFKYREGSRLEQATESLRGETENTTLQSLGATLEELSMDLDMDKSTFGFDLFRRVSVERNW